MLFIICYKEFINKLNMKKMEFTLEDKMKAIFNSGDVVKFEKVLRTKNGEKHYKYVWNVDGNQTRNWFGFDTIDECVEDCLTHLTINSL